MKNQRSSTARRALVALALAACALGLPARGSSTSSFDPGQLTTQLTVSVVGLGIVSSSPSGITCGNGSVDCVSFFARGSDVTLTATEAPPTAFDPGTVIRGWRITGTLLPHCQGVPAPQTCTLPMDGATIDVQVTFASRSAPIPLVPSGSLTVVKQGSGSGAVAGLDLNAGKQAIDCGSSCSFTAGQTGDTVELTATASGGSTFGGWSGSGCSGTGVCRVTLDGTAQSVTATFDPLPYGSVTIARLGNGTGTVAGTTAAARTPVILCGTSCSYSTAAGTTVELTATPAAGSRFAGWGGSCSGTGACQVVLATAAKSVTADFEPISTATPHPPAPTTPAPVATVPPPPVSPPPPLAPQTKPLAARIVYAIAVRGRHGRVLRTRIRVSKPAFATSRLVAHGRTRLQRRAVVKPGPNVLAFLIPAAVREGVYQLVITLQDGTGAAKTYRATVAVPAA